MLSDHVERYLTLRRSLGFELRYAARNLHAFVGFATDRGDTHVRATTAVDWAAQASSPWARHVRLRDIVLLARFLHAEDPAHEVPPARFFHVRLVRQPPYIYTPAEIGQLLAAAAGLRRTYPLRRRVYTTLIGLLAATGLRVSEALDLRLAAIAPDRQRRPRLLDLRHTFATRSLQQCSTRRESVARHFVALATYLGHADIANTYWYLEATPELMADLATASESLVAGRLA